MRRIFCVGRNYAAHDGPRPDLKPPFFFLKPSDAVVDNGATVPYPPETANFITRSDTGVDEALKHVFGYAVGIDLMRRTRNSPRVTKGNPGTGARF